MMQKGKLILAVTFSLTLGAVAVPDSGGAAVDWTLLKEINLDSQPLDIAASADGKMVFILVPGEVLVYFRENDKIYGRIPVDKAFNRLTYSLGSNGLVLSSTQGKRIKIFRVEPIHEIGIKGRPFKGPRNALVTIAVFSDYQ